MQLYKTLISFSVTGSLALASSLSVYQDSAVYRYVPQNIFIGFANNIKVKCKGEEIVLQTKPTCPEDARLCKERGLLKETERKLKAIQANISALNTFISLPQPNTFEAQTWIEAARKIGEEQAELSIAETGFKSELQSQIQAFRKQAPVQKARYLTQKCNTGLEVDLPYGQILFKTYYEAQLLKEQKIRVTQYLSVTNRSGIDMEAEDAMFYYRPAQQRISPIHFSPWVVGKYTPQPKRLYVKKAANRRMLSDGVIPEMATPIAEVNAAVPVAKYLSAREYRIKDLSLPSTGEPVTVEVTSWNAPLHCELRAYPYRSTMAFHVCSFQPKTQIERNSWKIKEDGEIINDHARGEYNKGMYHLYMKADLDVKIEQRPLVGKERTTGIFGSTVRKRDGYRLVLTNKSDKRKKLLLTERIPTSATEEIKVKLLHVKSENKVDYSVQKEGELEIVAVLKPHETKNIEILFEISYDKTLKIDY